MMKIARFIGVLVLLVVSAVPAFAQEGKLVALGLKGIGARQAYIFDANAPKSPYALVLYGDHTVTTTIFAHSFNLNFADDKGDNVNAQCAIDAQGVISLDQWLDGGDEFEVVVDNKANPPTVIVATTQSKFAPSSAPGGNLIYDALFESPLQPWFVPVPASSCFVEKRLSDSAAQGRFVLSVVGWDNGGSVIQSPAIGLGAGKLSAGMSVRSFGDHVTGKVELVIVDEKGKRHAAFGSAELDGKGVWSRVERAGQVLDEPIKRGSLAIVISGPQKGARVEIDQVGLFQGEQLGPIDGKFDLTWLEAVTLANGKGWIGGPFRFSYAESTVRDMSLWGGGGITDKDNQPVVHTIQANVPGPHRLWCRFLAHGPLGEDVFTIALRQNGRIVAQKEICDSARQYKHGHMAWESLDANLDAGPVELVLSRPTSGMSGYGREIDLFAFTNFMDYKPDMADFYPHGYMRFTNESTGQEPFCAWIDIYRHAEPYGVRLGILSMAGAAVTHESPIPTDKSKWITPGDTTPWIPISRYLLSAQGRNNVTLTMTRKNITEGLVQGRIHGALEFAVGDERKIVKHIPIDQEGPRVVLALPYDFEHLAAQIRSADDFISKNEKLIAGYPPRPNARYLDITTGMGLQLGLDSTDAVVRELGILKTLGFNGVFDLCAPPEKALSFYKAQKLQPYFLSGSGGVWDMFDGDCPYRPQTAMMEQAFSNVAKLYAPIMDHVNKVVIMDEPGGVLFDHMRGCPTCLRVFVEQLKAAGMTPRDLGVQTWEQVAFVPPEEKARKPELYYLSSLFRLQSTAVKARSIVEVKRRHLPDTARTFVNLGPIYSGALTWANRSGCGIDPWLEQRNGGFEMGWTEDYVGYGLGPQEAATQIAMIRNAGVAQPMGVYVCCEPGTPVMEQVFRLKLYHAVAQGARCINVYNYGPWYAGIDSWSEDTYMYPIVAAALHDMGVIDEALNGTTRRPTSVAILYNRTSAIWEIPDGAFGNDAGYMRWALAHGGYDADFISEEDVEAGALDHYKALFATGANMRKPAAERIAAWVKAGGTLMGTAGVGSLDPYNRPMNTLDAVFGVHSSGLKCESPMGLPRFQLRAQKPLDQLTGVAGSGLPAVTFDQLCWRESLEPLPGAKVVLTDKAGKPAGVLNRFGRGTALRLAALPGLAYVYAASTVPGYDPGKYVPPSYPAPLRDLIVAVCSMAKIEPVATFDDVGFEVVRYEAPDRIVLFVIDNLNKTRPAAVVYLHDAKDFKSVESAAGQKVTSELQPNGVLKLTLPLNAADALVLRK